MTTAKVAKSLLGCRIGANDIGQSDEPVDYGGVVRADASFRYRDHCASENYEIGDGAENSIQGTVVGPLDDHLCVLLCEVVCVLLDEEVGLLDALLVGQPVQFGLAGGWGEVKEAPITRELIQGHHQS